jgi:CheY-like chemotaxis protein
MLRTRAGLYGAPTGAGRVGDAWMRLQPPEAPSLGWGVMNAPQILIADDQEGHRRLLDLLLSIEGYEITMVEDGREALAWLQQHTPDLAILDVAMPFVNGLEVADRMRRVTRLKGVKIVILTAARDERTRELARLAKVDALVLKPLEGKDFRALVRSVLAGRAAPDLTRAGRPGVSAAVDAPRRGGAPRSWRR